MFELLGISGLGILGFSALPMFLDLFKKEKVCEINVDEEFFDVSKLESFFRNTNLVNKDKEVPCLISFETNRTITKFKIKLCDGVSKTDLEKKKEYFLVYFKANDIRFFYDDEKNVDVELIKNKFREKYLFEFTELKEPRKIILGYDVLGNLIQEDIYKHLLISGMTGFGKTIFLQTILLNALYNFSNLELELFDFKGTDLAYFSKLKNTKSFSSDIENALESLKSLEEEMNNRYEIFRKNKVSKIEEFNNISTQKMNYKYLVFDEISILNSSKEGKECYKILSRISSKCRACGMIVILCTQRPDTVNIPSDIKANIGLVVGFKCNNKFSSEVVCGKSCLEFLQNEGEAISFGMKEQNFKSMFLDTEQLKKYISNMKK